MKKVLILIFLIIFSACDNSSLKTKKESKNESKNEISDVETDDWYVDFTLRGDAEKIGLISIIKNVPQEQANLILRDYLLKTDGTDFYTISEIPNYMFKLVDSIAQKNNLSRKLTASIIFSYKYEMITEDELKEKYSEGRENE